MKCHEAISIRKQGDLLKDINLWNNCPIDTMGVMAVRIDQSPAVFEYTRNRYIYELYKDFYLIVFIDIEWKDFEALCKKQTVKQAPIYSTFSNDDPDAQQLIMQVMKQLQVNRKDADHTMNHVLMDIKNGCYRMYLQPKMDIGHNTIVGAEALVRYCNEDGIILPPAKFISQLEDQGMIFHIDLFIFEEVCKQLRNWKQKGKELLPISLNFSRITLLNDHLIWKMNEIQHQYGVDRKLIEIEITESVGEMDQRLLKKIGMQISNHGYRLSLDDFGVRYSNVALLSLLPFHTLKLDKGIVQELEENKKLQIIIEDLIQLCKRLEIDFIAEGIETMAQKELLKELGCTKIQGYLVNRPISVADYEKIYLR
ncbi:MAG: EAL domain-containing protein [[Clostridium] innocuum]|nr:EAL domain-containing protein [[Clostridium] innocuum]MBS5685841.1 EAL domain-containing protein [[Clostridium] innocuum]